MYAYITLLTDHTIIAILYTNVHISYLYCLVPTNYLLGDFSLSLNPFPYVEIFNVMYNFPTTRIVYCQNQLFSHLHPPRRKQYYWKFSCVLVFFSRNHTGSWHWALDWYSGNNITPFVINSSGPFGWHTGIREQPKHMIVSDSWNIHASTGGWCVCVCVCVCSVCADQMNAFVSDLMFLDVLRFFDEPGIGLPWWNKCAVDLLSLCFYMDGIPYKKKTNTEALPLSFHVDPKTKVDKASFHRPMLGCV